MKTKVLSAFCLASVIMLAGSFTVREKEEALTPSVDYYLLQGDKAFTAFISNLQKMEALVYIPKSKLTSAKAMNLALIPKEKAIAINKQMAKSGDDFAQIFPSDDNTKEVSLNFEKINMVCYVNRSSGSDDWRNADQLKIKWDGGSLFHKVESVTIDAARPEELQIKVEGSKVMEAYVPVGIIDIDTLP